MRAVCSGQMDGIKRKLVWGHDVDGGVQEEGDAGPCVDAALGGGRACPHPALNVKDVLSRLDLLGTYDLKGDTIFTHAKNQSSPDTSAYAQPSSVPFAWLSAQPRNSSLNLYDGEETRVTDEWNLQKSISNDTHRPPSQADSSGCQPQRTACASSSDFDEQADDSGMSIVRWFKNTAGSPDWLQATLVGSVDGTRGRLPLFGGADSPSRDGTPLLAKLKEKGPPKTLCKNLPKRDAGEQTPFGRDRPKLLHTPDAIAMRKAIEAEIILEPVSTYRSSADSLRSPPAVLSHRNSGSWSVRGSNSARSSSEGRESSPGGYSTSRSARLSAGGRSHHDSMHTGRRDFTWPCAEERDACTFWRLNCFVVCKAAVLDASFVGRPLLSLPSSS